MGTRYAYEILIPRTSVETLIESVMRHVVDQDARRLLTNSQFDFEAEVCGEVCLTFLFTPDDSIPDFIRIDPRSDPATNRVAVGCVWSSINRGDRYALFEATAASSNISSAFLDSPKIRAVFLQIAQESEALLLAFDDERCSRALVWPLKARTREFDIDEFCNDEGKMDIDQYGSWLLSENEHLSLNRADDRVRGE
ncbi:MAG TPA: hypothetical protein VFT74_14160 [Isosphaeraceae bacterium]|nr:hypothetical protein [Isosphaeraceae bacterium]